MNRTLARRLGVPALVAAGALLVAGPASAHVTVNPNSGTTGGYLQATFRVPNERDDAGTVKVEVIFPTDTPLASVLTQPVPGWTATVATTKLAEPIQSDDGAITEAVSSITWTGGMIKVGEFQNFPVSLGPLPDQPTTLVFKALQTYSNGEVVRWIDLPNADGTRPDHPAPTLTVSAPGTAPVTAAVTDAASTESTSAAQPDGMARWLAGGALLAALAALGVALARRRQPSEAAAEPSVASEEVPARTGAGV